MAPILVGTADGLHVVGDGAGPVQHPGRSVTGLGRDDWELWAILDQREVWHTAAREWWFRVATLDDLDGNCVAGTAAGVIVGTSEAHLFRVAGEGIERVDGFDLVEGRAEWYTPWGGPSDARSISEDDDAVYVNVHVGGIVRSLDHGVTWKPTIDIHSDVHRVWANEGYVFAACARGLAVSRDQGGSWDIRTEGLHSTYCRSVAMCGGTVLVTASSGPRGGRGAVYRGRLDGESFERCREGLPEWFDDNIDSYCLDATPDLAAFGTTDGRVFSTTNQGAAWEEVASGLPAVQCLVLMP